MNLEILLKEYITYFAIPAQAGIQDKSGRKDISNNENYRKNTSLMTVLLKKMLDSRLRGNDITVEFIY